MQRPGRLTQWAIMLLLTATPPILAQAGDLYRLDVSGVAHTDFASRPQIGFPVPGEGFGSASMENHLGMAVRLTRLLGDGTGAGLFLEGMRLSGRSEPVAWNRDFSAVGGPARGQLQSASNAYSFHLLAGLSGRRAVRIVGLPLFVQGSVAAGGAMGRLEQWTGIYDLDDATADVALVTREFLTGTQFTYKFDTSLGTRLMGYDIQGGLYYVGTDLIRDRFALNGMGVNLTFGAEL